MTSSNTWTITQHASKIVHNRLTMFWVLLSYLLGNKAHGKNPFLGESVLFAPGKRNFWHFSSAYFMSLRCNNTRLPVMALGIIRKSLVFSNPVGFPLKPPRTLLRPFLLIDFSVSPCLKEIVTPIPTVTVKILTNALSFKEWTCLVRYSSDELLCG